MGILYSCGQNVTMHCLISVDRFLSSFRYLCFPLSHALSNRMPSRKLRLHCPMLFWEISSQSSLSYFLKDEPRSAWARLIPTRISSWNTWLLSVTKFPPTQRHRTDFYVIVQQHHTYKFIMMVWQWLGKAASWAGIFVCANVVQDALVWASQIYGLNPQFSSEAEHRVAQLHLLQFHLN